MSKIMRQVEIVLGVLQQGEEYLFQFRNGDARIGAAGLIGCFGGKINPDEFPHEAVSREISEETTFESDPSNWNLIGEVYVESDHQLEPVKIHAIAFHHKVDNVAQVEAKEGELVRMNLEDIWNRLHELTPATKALFQEFYKEK